MTTMQPPRTCLMVELPVDRLPEVRLPCVECGAIFTPAGDTFWLEIPRGPYKVVVPVCSVVCRDGCQVREALAAAAQEEERSKRGLPIRNLIAGGRVTGGTAAAAFAFPAGAPARVP